MHNSNTDQAPTPPSSRSLVRSTVIALLTAGVLLVTVVMPAEYGVDPTRIGSVLGLTQMGKLKQALATEAAGHGSAGAPAMLEVGTATASPGEGSNGAAADSAERRNQTTITLLPNQGKEVKLIMQAGARAGYSWSTKNGPVNFDTHGEPFNAPSDFYHSYSKDNGVTSHQGEIVAAFDGLHGWFWRNVGTTEVTVTLETSGDYQDIRILE